MDIIYQWFGLSWSHDDVLDDADDQDDALDLCEALTKMLVVGENNVARVISMQDIFHHDNTWSHQLLITYWGDIG